LVAGHGLEADEGSGAEAGLDRRHGSVGARELGGQLGLALSVSFAVPGCATAGSGRVVVVRSVG
jgi:hypothetical protein